MTVKTKTGAAMNIKIRTSLIDLLSSPEHEGKTQKEIALLLNVTARTVQNYLTADVWQEIHHRRLEVIGHSLDLVDRAVYIKAIKGDMVAAKILYKRWDEEREKENQPFITIEDEEQQQIEIKRLEQDIQELENEKGNNRT